MNPLSDFSDRLVTLNDGTSGLRSTIPVEIRETSFREAVSQPGGSDLRRDGESNFYDSCLDFISSDETLDRCNEVITAAGWNLHNQKSIVRDTLHVLRLNHIVRVTCSFHPHP